MNEKDYETLDKFKTALESIARTAPKGSLVQEIAEKALNENENENESN